MASETRYSLFVLAGTIAEFIKLAPLVDDFTRRGVPFRLIATGQNDLTTSDLLPLAKPSGVDRWILREPIRQTPAGLIWWFLKAFVLAIFAFRKEFRTLPRGKKPLVIVHGDTISTLMGGLTAWLCGAKICHVEAGLRSFNLMRPFPEEICRIVVTRFAHLAFCPNAWAAGNLARHKHLQIHVTRENTLLDAQRMALQAPEVLKKGVDIPEKYFVFVAHRQENLLDQPFLERLLALVSRQAQKLSCVMIMHEPTREALRGNGLLERIESDPNIRALPRQPFVAFTQLLAGAEYIVTDGGSNQEESYYLGRPCLVLRKETERREGLGENVVLSLKDFETIEAFLADPARFARPPVRSDMEPTRIISEVLAPCLFAPARSEP